MAEQNTDQRLANLEQRVSELEHQRRVQEDRDIALLARIDTFIDSLHRVERTQMRGFEQLHGQLKDHEVRLDRLETNVNTLVEATKDHKAAIETLAGNVNTLASGQAQILAILTGQQRRDD